MQDPSSIDRLRSNLLYQSVEVIKELDSKQRKIRSLRGFFLYALEIIENGKDYQILHTNLQLFFWRKVKNIIRQNKKAALQEFLFNTAEINKDQTVGSILHLEDQIKILQNQVNSLQDRISDLETKLTFEENSKYALSRTLEAPDTMKSIQQGDYTLQNKNEPYLLRNDSPIFITLGKIPENEKIEIIKKGFQLNQEGKMSLKKYYESTQESSLFKLKGYSIRYETIRRTKFYSQLK